ncbi:MAG: acyl-CoA thioester hydrolase [Limisphaerales bacterium]
MQSSPSSFSKKQLANMGLSIHNRDTYSIRIIQNIVWGEMDAFSHVNNTVYFRYFENGRIDYFAKLDILNQNGEGPILAHTQCQYVRALIYPDEIEIGTRVSKISNTSFKMDNAVWSKSFGLAAYSSSIIVLINYKTGEKIKVSDEFKQKVNALEGKEI